MTWALIALIVLLAVTTGYACGRARYWRIEAKVLRHLYLETLKNPQFIRPDLRGISDALAEVDRVRAEIARETGIDNVIEVDFRGGDHAS